jgi:oligoribonuclease NrnB/cAMP/cGMP phosphodiesterase (DHH superfamily)
MRTLIAHWDADGVISAAILIKHIGGDGWKLRFASAVSVKDAILRSAMGRLSLEEIYIMDITPSRYAVRAASVYDRAVWIDHHEGGEIDERRENVEIVLDPESPSCARVVARYLGVEDALVRIADQIDVNDVREDMASRLRDVIGYVRWKFHGKDLERALTEATFTLATEGISALLERYTEGVMEYLKWLAAAVSKAIDRARTFHVRGLEVTVVETEDRLPVYAVFNKLKSAGCLPDILVVMYTKPRRDGTVSTKLEFRTAGDVDVRKLALLFGGGGHRKASGASVDGPVTSGEIIRAIELLY